MTIDLWTCNHTTINYMGVTSHHISNEWELVNKVVMTAKFPDCPKTAENIRNELEERLESLGMSNKTLKVKFVTDQSDQGANMRKALEDYIRIPCSAHKINTVLRHTFDANFLQD